MEEMMLEDCWASVVFASIKLMRESEMSLGRRTLLRNDEIPFHFETENNN